MNNTVIVLWGDHGYHLGDHNQWGKHTQFENAVRCPFIISSPNGNTGVIDNPVELVDVYPTICDLAGVSIPQSNLQGTSLSAVFNGGAITKKYAVSEYRSGGGSSYSFRTERYRLTLWFSGSSDRPDLISWDSNRIKEIELYDYETDPYETINLADDSNYTDVLNDLLAKAEEWWGTQNAFFTKEQEVDLSLPFIEHFENYLVNTTFSGDFWVNENSLWDRIWKGTYLNSFGAGIVDDSNNGGSNALKFILDPMNINDGGVDIKLRTFLMTEYDASNNFYSLI